MSKLLKKEIQYFLKEAIKEAVEGVEKAEGGPFGAVIVLNNKIIVRAHNMVRSTNDPTAHAEVVAIRKASQILKNYHLEGCVLIATSEPCPMCLAAIYWARIKEVYYGCDRYEAAKAGFSDEYLYKLFRAEVMPRIPVIKTKLKGCDYPFKLWSQLEGELY